MRNRVSFRVKLPLSCLSIGLRVFFLILSIETFLIADTDFLRNMNLRVRLGLEMLTTFVDSGPIEGILVSFSVGGYLWATVVAFGFEDHVPISIDIFDGLLPMIVGLRIIIFSDEDDSVV